MFKFYRKSGIIIPGKYKDEIFYFQIKEHLKRRMQKYQTPDYTICNFFLESDEAMLIPRFFPLNKVLTNYKIEDQIPDGNTINIEHNIVAKNDAQQRSINYVSGIKNCILQLPPATGKTVIMIHRIAELKKKSFILVHRDSLAEQWRDKFLEFTNLKDEDISRLISNSFEKDLQKPVIICTDQTFISLLKRKRLEFLTKLNQAKIGVLVADEVHTSVGAPSFSECSIHIPAEYVYGLSATPYRWDGNGDIIEYHLGDIYEDDDTEGTMDARVTILMVDYKIDQPMRRKYLHWEDQFQRSRYLNIMKNSKQFMWVVKSILNKFKGDRNVLFIGERVDKLLEILYKWIHHNDKSKFYGTAGLEALDHSLIFATPGKMRDGIDCTHIDCLIMTSPITNIKQMTGRINRIHPGKKQPIIVDMVDIGCDNMRNTVWKRLEYYKKRNWQIQYILYINGGSKVVDEEIAINILSGK